MSSTSNARWPKLRARAVGLGVPVVRELEKRCALGIGARLVGWSRKKDQRETARGIVDAADLLEAQEPAVECETGLDVADPHHRMQIAHRLSLWSKSDHYARGAQGGMQKEPLGRGDGCFCSNGTLRGGCSASSATRAPRGGAAGDKRWMIRARLIRSPQCFISLRSETIRANQSGRNRAVRAQ